MLFYYLYHLQDFCLGILIISLLVTACAGYAYFVNSQRSADDPEKKKYHPEALLLVLFTWPILLPVIVSLFLLRVLVYSLFVILFAIFLLIIPRETREPTWAESKLLKFGDKLLEANSFLIKLLQRPWATEPGPL